MILFKKAKDLSQYIAQQKKSEASVGFVPTMGALHQGHLALIKSAKEKDQLVVCSIFVNPTQFNNPEDFKHYPVTIEKDIEQLITAGCDVLFLPAKDEIYPEGYQPKHYDLGNLETILEGHYRPGHFQGVCQVVDRLLDIVQPSFLYLGQKDFQQCKVIDKLLHLTNKQNAVQLIISPTVREKDGLAMSSRNLRLSPQQRAMAPVLFESLTYVKNHFDGMGISELKKEAFQLLETNGFKVDYLEIADAATLLPVVDHKGPALALVAAYLDKVRLIDNLSLT